MLMRRRAGTDNVPYAFFTMAYGNEVLQVVRRQNIWHRTGRSFDECWPRLEG